MRCNEIENRLPAYLEKLLSPEEGKNIERHLASCPRCRHTSEALKKVEGIMQDLTEVEPPPFFEQRIMSRVREEAVQKQGILRKLFYPLYIKVPLQAFATILVAVIAFSIYRTGELELKHLTPSATTQTEPAKDQIATKSGKAPAAPAAVTPVTRTPAGDLLEKRQQRFVAPSIENGTKADRSAGSSLSLKGEQVPAMKRAAPGMAAREKESLPLRAETLFKAQDRAGKQEADRSFETSLPEHKRKGKMAPIGAVPAPSQVTDAAAKRSALDLTIHVKDDYVAVREVEERIGQVNGRIIVKQHREGRALLKVEIATQNLAAFLHQLNAIGRVKTETSPRTVADGMVTINIEIANEP
jgi:hypothetical protein